PHREIDFRRNHYLIAPGKVTKGATQYFFAGAISIHVGGLEKVDSQFERSLNENAAIFFLQKPFSFRQAIAHTAQTDSRYFEPSLAKICVVHSFITPHCCFASAPLPR